MILLKIILQKLAVITTKVKTGLLFRNEYNLTWKRSWSRFFKVV